jgi:hypothetical protein
MFRAQTIAAVLVWATAGITGTLMFLFLTPTLESRYAPVLINQTAKVDPADRTTGQVCWTWAWEKVRYAQPITTSWSIVVDGTAVEYPAVVQRQRDGEVLRDVRPAALGKGTNDLCAVIPNELDKLRTLTIRGQINYRMPHGLWTVWQELPVVRVPPLNGITVN